MNKRINLEILNDFINIIIMDVATKYLFKLKRDKKNPPKLIKDYLDKSIFLTKNYDAIQVSQVKNIINNIDQQDQKEFEKLFKKYLEYESLCKELNFAFLLMIDNDLKDKTLNLLYDNVYEINFLYENKTITKKQVDINSVIKKSNPKELNKLHYYKDILNNNYSSVSM